MLQYDFHHFYLMSDRIKKPVEKLRFSKKDKAVCIKMVTTRIGK